MPKIDSIKVSGLQTFDDNFINKLDSFKTNLFFLDKLQINKLFETNNLIEEYKIFKVYPSSLEVEIIETKFLAKTNIDGKIFFVGSNGKLIETENNELDLPFIFGNFEINNFLKIKKNHRQFRFRF